MTVARLTEIAALFRPYFRYELSPAQFSCPPGTGTDVAWTALFVYTAMGKDPQFHDARDPRWPVHWMLWGILPNEAGLADMLVRTVDLAHVYLPIKAQGYRIAEGVLIHSSRRKRHPDPRGVGCRELSTRPFTRASVTS
jgi:hypothetical protein